jgi:L-threonylcarbamoyladenylate synthase
MIRPDNPETRTLAAAIIKAGGLIAFRTDTFYGIGADPLNAEAVAKIKILKGREEGKPILLLIADFADAESLVASKPQAYEVLSRALWPGPLTIVVPAVSALPVELTAGTGTVGMRLPNSEEVRQIVRECGGKLTATSANPSGSEAARSAGDVSGYFAAGLDLIVDGGEVAATEASSVIDVTGLVPRLLREGALSRNEIEKVLGRVE